MSDTYETVMLTETLLSSDQQVVELEDGRLEITAIMVDRMRRLIGGNSTIILADTMVLLSGRQATLAYADHTETGAIYRNR